MPCFSRLAKSLVVTFIEVGKRYRPMVQFCQESPQVRLRRKKRHFFAGSAFQSILVAVIIIT